MTDAIMRLQGSSQYAPANHRVNCLRDGDHEGLHTPHIVILKIIMNTARPKMD